MNLSKEQEEIYKKTLGEVEKHLKDIDAQTEEEIQQLRERLAKIEESKKALKQTYLGLAEVLGLEVEIEEGDEKELEDSLSSPS